MASIKFSALVGDARGSIGGNVFSRNANGGYVRNRTTPINPSTSKQANVRARMMTVINAWRAMTADEKHKWATQVSSNGYMSRVGESQTYTGYQLFLKRNLQLLAIGQPIVVDIPVDPVFPDSYSDSLDLEAAVGGASFSVADMIFNVAPGTSGQTLVIYSTGNLSTGVTSTAQSYRQVSTHDASSGTTFDFSSGLLGLLGTPQVGAQLIVKARVVDNASGFSKDLNTLSAIIEQGI